MDLQPKGQNFCRAFAVVIKMWIKLYDNEQQIGLAHLQNEHVQKQVHTRRGTCATWVEYIITKFRWHERKEREQDYVQVMITNKYSNS